MNYYVVVIREFQPKDSVAVNELVRQGYLSNVPSSCCNAIMKEITFQLIVISAAIMFIFIGIPLQYCVLSIPFVLCLIYVSVYSAFLMKATELVHGQRPLNCWVAEVLEPYFSSVVPEKSNIKIVDETKWRYENRDEGRYKRRIIGTVAVARHKYNENAAWLFRLVVDRNYRRRGIGSALVRTTQDWCRSNHYRTLELAISECQEYTRQVFADTKFDIKQMYHKPILGNGLTLLMYHMQTRLDKPIF